MGALSPPGFNWLTRLFWILQHSPALKTHGGCVVVSTIANHKINVNSKANFLFDGYLIGL
jgi:hypothetical protein